MADALVLNRGFYAVHIAPWQKALSLLYQGHAEVVDENYRTYDFESWVEVSKAMKDHPIGFAHSATLRVAIPEVIRLTRYDRLPSQDVKFTRRNIYEHYNNTCSYCGLKFATKDLNLDHVMPRSRGGKTNWENIVLSCIPCNKRKADRTPQEAGMKLLVVPKKPRWRGPSNMIVRMPVKVQRSWQFFIDRAYWDQDLDKD